MWKDDKRVELITTVLLCTPASLARFYLGIDYAGKAPELSFLWALGVRSVGLTPQLNKRSSNR